MLKSCRFLLRSKRSSIHLKAKKRFVSKKTEYPQLTETLTAGLAASTAKVIGVFGVATAAVTVYAWYDPKFRLKIEDNVPYTRETISYIFGPTTTESASKATDENNSALVSLPESDLSDQTQDNEITQESKDTSTRWDDGDTSSGNTVSEKLSPQEESKLQAQMVKQAAIEAERKEASQNEELEKLVQSTKAKAEDEVNKALDLQKQLVEVMKDNTSKLKTAISNEDVNTVDAHWTEFTETSHEARNLENEAEQAHTSAMETLSQLKQIHDEARANKVVRNNKCLRPALNLVNESKKYLVKADENVRKARVNTQNVLLSKENMDFLRNRFQEEIDVIKPDVTDRQKAAKKLTEDELNSLLIHAYRRINQMQLQISQQIAFEVERTQAALDEQMKTNELNAAEHARQLLDIQQTEFDIEKDKLLTDSAVIAERQLVQELARSSAAHSEHLKDVLQTQYTELEKLSEKRLNAALIEVRQAFQAEMAGWIARVRGIETAVEGRAEEEKVARDAQILWLACVALNGIISRGNERENLIWEQQLLPLSPQLTTIREAANGNILVESVIETIPEKASSRGVWKEDNLTKRFKKVRKMCKRVAMIDEDNRTLFRYFVSYLQSFFVFPSVHAKSVNEPVSSDDLDTFSCLAHANYWLKQGDIETALRYMNQLEGEPRNVASDWINETRLLLEVRQAARLLTAFASASGLGSIF